MSHVVDEISFHFVELVLGKDGADGKDEKSRDEHNHADADDGVEVCVAAENDRGGGEGKQKIKTLV